MNISNMSEELNRWYEENCNQGNLAWSFLAKKSGVSVSQICKIAKGHVASPKYETVKALLEVLYPDDSIAVYEYLLKQYPRHTVALKGFSESKRSKVAVADRHLFRDILTFRVFKIADSGAFKVSQLEKEFGVTQIRPRIDALIKANYIEINENGFLVRSPYYEKTVLNEIASIAEEFHHVVDILASKKLVARNSDTEIDEIFNRLTYYHSSFNAEALKEIGKETREFVNYIFTKYKDSKFQGDIPAFINIATGRFDNH